MIGHFVDYSVGAHQFGNKPVIYGAVYIERYPPHILHIFFLTNPSGLPSMYLSTCAPGHPFSQYLRFLMSDCPYIPWSCKWTIPTVTQNPLSIDTISPVPWRGTIISDIKLEVLVYFLPVVRFSPSKFDGNDHLPFAYFGRSFPSCILIRYITG